MLSGKHSSGPGKIEHCLKNGEKFLFVLLKRTFRPESGGNIDFCSSHCRSGSVCVTGKGLHDNQIHIIAGVSTPRSTAFQPGPAADPHIVRASEQLATGVSSLHLRYRSRGGSDASDGAKVHNISEKSSN